MQLATDRGMVVRPSPDNPALCKIQCKACGWPEDVGFDVVVERYVQEPYGCAACAEASEGN